MFSVSPSLYRLPFLLANIAAHTVSTTPPNKAPTSSEQRRYARRTNPARPLLSIATLQKLGLFMIIGFHTFASCEFMASANVMQKIPVLVDILIPQTELATSLSHRMRVSPALVVGSLLCLLGCILRMMCYRTLGKYFTFELALKDGHKLITHGPYSFVRHPAYLGMLMVVTGFTIANFGPGSWWFEVTTAANSTLIVQALAAMYTITPSFFFFMIFDRVSKEDRVLREAFGQEWLEWSQKTRFRLLPGLY